MNETKTFQRYLDKGAHLVFKPSLLALALMLASVACYPMNTRVLQRLFDDSYIVSVLIESMLLTSLALAVSIVAYSVLHPLWKGFSTRAEVCSAVVYSVMTCLFCALMYQGIANAVGMVIIGICLGIAIIPPLMAWVSCYLLDFRNVMFYGALVFLIATTISWIFTVVPTALLLVLFPASAVIGSVVPVVSTFRSRRNHTTTPEDNSAEKTDQDNQNQTSLGDSIRNLLSIIWIPLIGFLLYLLCSAVYPFSLDGVLNSGLVSGPIAGIIALIVCLKRTLTPAAILVEKVVVPLMVAFCIVLGSFPTATLPFFLGAFTVNVPLMFLAIYTLSVLVSVTAAGEFSMPFVFGLMFSLCAAVLVCGTMVMNCTDVNVNYGEGLWTILCIYFAVIILSLAFSSWKHAMQNNDGAELGAEKPRMTSSADESGYASEQYRKRVDTISDAFALSDRESEILGYVGRGHSSTYIAKTLFISNSTVRTHIRHIYQKLDIGSKEQLFSLMDKNAVDEQVEQEVPLPYK